MSSTIVLIMLTAMSLNATAEKTPHGVGYPAKIVRVVDGDTVVIEAPYLPAPLKPELAVRIFGVDTPEKGALAKCPEENKKSIDATNFTKSVIASSTRQEVILYGWDKYGGRVLGDIVINGKSLRTQLINGGYAREYYGEAKQSWCAK